jgi:hypothetical protein
MSVVTATTKEQWEALVVESRFWKRSRQGPPGGNPGFDRIDQETIIEDYLNEFRGSVSDLSSMNNPMARFYRLFYTDEFLDFRSQTLSEKRGASSLSRGVSELAIDQTFRYFVLVEANRTNAKRFAQLVVGVAVFRNTFDESSMIFLKDSLRKTNRRIFNNKPLAFPSPSTEMDEVVEDEEPLEDAEAARGGDLGRAPGAWGKPAAVGCSRDSGSMSAMLKSPIAKKMRCLSSSCAQRAPSIQQRSMEAKEPCGTS